jgi:uncharacterized membrane protein
MNNQRFSLFKSLKDSLSAVLDNFGMFFKPLLVLIAVGMLSVAIAGLFNKDFFIQLSQLKQQSEKKLEACDNMNPILGTPNVVFSARQIECQREAVWPILELIKNNIIKLLVPQILLILLFCWLWLGYTRYVLNMHDKKNSSLKALFSQSFFKVVKFMIAGSLYLLIVGVGLFLFVVPGIYWGIRFGFFRYNIVDKNAGIIESLSESWKSTEHNEWNLFALLLIASFIWMGGIAILLIPIISYMYVCVYRQITGNESQSIHVQQTSMY